MLLKAARLGKPISNGIGGAIPRTILHEARNRRINLVHFKQLALGRASIGAVDDAAVGSQNDAVTIS